ncbi:ABC transporter permease [Pseudonocardia broussonetiae]|uniref:FtsX-like permease family protein n=1 Tax=Pseudonocardia broussonetiae TaxID=2736640 RepID=A0A6M6JN08_9PSEU|nr:FtsX-like permease family protein [Pseudonocardia broussonetiae]QJY48470.1 FtsX-like permease family protein [Pseudonocardia broussonetiae]
MAVVAVWLRLELRRRWRSLLVLTLLVALSAGVVLTAVAGARRGAGALDRLLAQTLPATIAVLPSTPGFDWDAVRALPGVTALSEFGVAPAEVDGVPVDLPFDLRPGTVEVPVVLEGRAADPARADEAVVTPGYVEASGRGVGDVVTLALPDPSVVDAAGLADGGSAPPSAGPVLTVRIVGVVRSFVLADRPGDAPVPHPSPGLLAQYRPHLLGTSDQAALQALVRLDGGAAAVPAFQAALVALTGRTDIAYLDLSAQQAKIGRTLAFESASLLAFGLAALAAATVLVGQAVVRGAGAAAADLRVLRALGMPRRLATAAAAAGPALAGLAGTALGAGAAAAASAWFPFGTAAGFEPDPGPAVDAPVLGAGGAALVLLVVAGAVLAGRPAPSGSAAGGPQRSAVAAAAARAGLPVPVLVGTRFALEPGRGRSALPVRPALVGAVAGVLGVLAALTFSAGVSEAADNPDRFGQTHRLQAWFGYFGEDLGGPAGPVLDAVAADPDVTGVLDVRDGVVDLRAPGGGAGAARPVTVFTGPPPGGRPFPTVLTAGRMPERADEVVLAPGTARDLRARPGDALAAAGPAGAAPLTVTGIGFVPAGPHNSYDDGAWLSPEGHAALAGTFRFHVGLVALRPGADAAAVAGRLAGVVGLEPVASPYEAGLLRNVEVLPLVLGGFLALLAVGAVGHALATAVRRRRHDVAVLRVLGMTRRQCRAVVATQAAVLAAVGLLFGVPLGLALGRVLWRLVADITPLQYAPPVALLALLLVVPVAVLVAGALAARPGHLAARLRIGHVLRAE